MHFEFSIQVLDEVRAWESSVPKEETHTEKLGTTEEATCQKISIWGEASGMRGWKKSSRSVKSCSALHSALKQGHLWIPRPALVTPASPRTQEATALPWSLAFLHLPLPCLVFAQSGLSYPSAPAPLMAGAVGWPHPLSNRPTTILCSRIPSRNEWDAGFSLADSLTASTFSSRVCRPTRQVLSTTYFYTSTCTEQLRNTVSFKKQKVSGKERSCQHSKEDRVTWRSLTLKVQAALQACRSWIVHPWQKDPRGWQRLRIEKPENTEPVDGKMADAEHQTCKCRRSTVLRYFISGTWASLDSGIRGVPGTNPLWIPRDDSLPKVPLICPPCPPSHLSFLPPVGDEHCHSLKCVWE